MTDTSQPTVDPSGITRTADGTIAPNAATTETTPKPATPDPEGTSLLNQTEPEPAPKDKASEPANKDKPKDTGAPEKYEAFKLPEGFKLAEGVQPKIETMFKDMGLSQANAQKLVDFYAEQSREFQSRPYEAYKEMTSQWATESKSHPDLKGKLGPGQEVNVRIAKALDSLGDPQLVSDFKALMDLTGAGNNQAFIRVIDRFAQKVTEGTHVSGKGPSEHGQTARGTAALPTAAAALWPNLKSSQT